MRNTQKKNNKKPGVSLRLAPDFFIKLLLILGVVLVWRGIWNLLDEYFLPESFLFSNIAGIIIGIVLIYLPDNDLDELV